MLSDILAGLSAVPLPNDLPPWETIYRRFQPAATFVGPKSLAQRQPDPWM
jgi:hypothetical protein